MAATHQTKVLIIGSGSAGCTAAIYAARAGLKPLMVHGMQPGGQLTITTEVENYPGFADVIQGPWLMEQMEQQAKNVGTEIIHDMIADVDLSKRPFIAKGDGGDIYEAETVIIATGASARWLGLPSEEKYQNFGVSACATCDGFFFKDKEVAVIGGGNTAAEEAVFLANLASKVTLIHRRDELRADKINTARVLKHEKIEVLWDTVVEDFLGDDDPKNLTGLKVKNVNTGEVSEVPVAGAFIAIGHVPNTGIFNNQLDMDETGYLVTKPDSTATNIPGVFAAGDAQDHVYRQAVTAAGTGCMAALEADRFLAAQEDADAA
jgi:thioredoxin reductase (NADPH)